MDGVIITDATLRTLLSEFRDKVGLTEVDAYRAAFCALAYHQGWNAARIGRYLGITRARVGQRVGKLRSYAETRDDVPVLTSLLRDAIRPGQGSRGVLPVAFEQSRWHDREFALGQLRLVAWQAHDNR